MNELVFCAKNKTKQKIIIIKVDWITLDLNHCWRKH